MKNGPAFLKSGFAYVTQQTATFKSPMIYQPARVIPQLIPSVPGQSQFRALIEKLRQPMLNKGTP